MIKSTLLAMAVASLAIGAAHAQRADRNCYEDVDCPWKKVAPVTQYRKLSCQALAHVRNHTYYENYYCFHTAAARSAYGNTGCKYQVTSAVPLNDFERANLVRIRMVEKEKRCN